MKKNMNINPSTLSDRTIGERLKKLRLVQGKSREDVADQLGIDTETYAKYERDVIEPPTERVIELKYILDTTTDYILLGYKPAADKQITELVSACPQSKRDLVVDTVKALVDALSTP